MGKQKDDDNKNKSANSTAQTKFTDVNSNSFSFNNNLAKEKLKGSSPLNTPVPLSSKLESKGEDESSGSSIPHPSEGISKRIEAKKRKLLNEKEKSKKKQKMNEEKAEKVEKIE